MPTSRLARVCAQRSFSTVVSRLLVLCVGSALLAAISTVLMPEAASASLPNVCGGETVRVTISDYDIPTFETQVPANSLIVYSVSLFVKAAGAWHLGSINIHPSGGGGLYKSLNLDGTGPATLSFVMKRDAQFAQAATSSLTEMTAFVTGSGTSGVDAEIRPAFLPIPTPTIRWRWWTDEDYSSA